ncbi:hypothetical protein CfE428DRAFT_0764 [Chthoniobacter flavus Ellin428]|uniref:Uncharacterized protein n=1 Tax=Chthoniobacter flavus Ellin428 TaxID=497964 RepID=B4CVS7_9BACT|nr:hypothetical protein [Chthoniobacter flavus]EDY21519.1 hypothetical protein CfE428DRAFT_0764 [Chthoniobacter flavus Ellin428]TCO95469.1 hypothetical protein EV701_101156 [Chthoniobacter flavus]
MPELTSPLAFELCEHGRCADVSVNEEAKGTDKFKVGSCKQDQDKCGGKGCYCQLFRRKKGSKDGVTWDVVRLNEEHKDTDYDGDKYEYQCFCVTPILETAATIDGFSYTVRFIPCDKSGLCALNKDVVPGLTGQTVLLKCEGKCDGDCKCTLFRLKVKKTAKEKADKVKWSEKDAKWEYVAPTGKEIALGDDVYYYRCFCVKPG